MVQDRRMEQFRQVDHSLVQKTIDGKNAGLKPVDIVLHYVERRSGDRRRHERTLKNSVKYLFSLHPRLGMGQGRRAVLESVAKMKPAEVKKKPETELIRLAQQLTSSLERHGYVVYHPQDKVFIIPKERIMVMRLAGKLVPYYAQK
ncbi:MAG: hypothetical protein AABX01_00615 [Candidatus Micrarchaeota archaeon]